ncbi:MAG TPA: hypothetical protein PKY05_12035 [Fibrobacteria bacterium]|nr:hypothetical protein [Fibrobacteria bacterium]
MGLPGDSACQCRILLWILALLVSMALVACASDCARANPPIQLRSDFVVFGNCLAGMESDSQVAFCRRAGFEGWGSLPWIP